MGTPPRTEWDYSGIVAAAYDHFFGDEPFWDQRFFEARLRGNGGRALELACGTGRLLVPLLRDGLDVEGLDTSADMLDILRRKARALNLAPVLYQCPMQAFDLPRRYQTVFVPAGSFRMLVHDEEIRATLACCLAALEPGGELIIPLDVEEPVVRETHAWRLRRDVEVPSHQARVRIHERIGYDPGTALIDWQLRWEVERTGQALERFEREHLLRYHRADDFAELLREAGFEAVQTRRGYTEMESTDPTDDMIFTARRPQH
jgi:SAM-dependent methyltransferase